MEIDRLLDIVARGGSVKTGIDIHNKQGALLLEKDVRVSSISTLLVIKQNGLCDLDIDSASKGGVWDKSGRSISLTTAEASAVPKVDTPDLSDVENRIKPNKQRQERGDTKT